MFKTNGMFSSRETVQDAIEYGQKILKAEGVPSMVALTALMVLYNTMAEIANEPPPPTELTIPVTINLSGEIEWEMIQEMVNRVNNRFPEAREVTIFSGDPRNESGFLHYQMRITYQSGGGITIGCVQREKGGAYEFHS